LDQVGDAIWQWAERRGLARARRGDREPTQDVLLRVYAKCISGQQDEAKRRILEATQPADTDETESGPGTAGNDGTPLS
jgi:hypothetical protein